MAANPYRVKRLILAVALLAATFIVAVPGHADVHSADTYASITPDGIVLGNSLVERRWRPDILETTSIKDHRTGVTLNQTSSPLDLESGVGDFVLHLDGVVVDRFATVDSTASVLPSGGIRLHIAAEAAGIRVDRNVDIFPNTAGFLTNTDITAIGGGSLSGYQLDRIGQIEATPTIHSFRAGADWRDPNWNPMSIGDAHTGDWRIEIAGGLGQPLEAQGEWLSLSAPSGQSAFMVLGRRDYASSRMQYAGGRGSAKVDLSRDVIYLGPFEEDGHIENLDTATPTGETLNGPGRHRALVPGRKLSLEPVYSGLATGPDDEPWQFFKLLTAGGISFRKPVTFNTNNVDSNRISTGAKDDVDYTTFLQLLDAAREMGVETFIFDDGWQAKSGDWCADSPECPEPRYNGSPTSKFRPRFPDGSFSQVQHDLRGDPSTSSDDVDLGLWMTPMEFHPASTAFRSNPQWACAPVGHGTAALSIVQPDSSSNEAGLGVWNPEAAGLHPDSGDSARLIDYIEDRIRRAIDIYGARYFKFDFLVWIDCGGAEPVDLYGYHDSFLAMVDRLIQDYPQVVFQIDETNDYRMFPFESTARGPAWFQNGKPQAKQLLHNLWNLAPFVPGYTIGQHALGDSNEVTTRGVDFLMAAALNSHITFWTDISKAFTPAQRSQIRKWTDFYKTYRDDIGTFTYPLLNDPLADNWTALQPWNLDSNSGFVLAYRLGSPVSSQSIALRGIGDGSYSLTRLDPATGTSISLGTVDATTLRNGYTVEISQPYGYAIIRIVPA